MKNMALTGWILLPMFNRPNTGYASLPDDEPPKNPKDKLLKILIIVIACFAGATAIIVEILK